MKLDIDKKKLIISSNDKKTYKLHSLNGLFNIGAYKKENYISETFKSVEIELYNNHYIKSNLYTNRLGNNVNEALKYLDKKHLFKINKLEDISDLEEIQGLEKLEEIQDLEKLEDLEGLKSLEDLEKLEEIQDLEKLEEIQDLEDLEIQDLEDLEIQGLEDLEIQGLEEMEFKIVEKYYIDIEVQYKTNEVLYILDLKNMELEDILHLFNLIEGNILYHYVDLYKHNGNTKYINLKFQYHEVIKYLDKFNYKFNEFNLLLFIQLNEKEFKRLYNFLKYAILQLHKLGYDYKRLNEMFLKLSKFIFKNNIYQLFNFLYDMHYFKYIAYHKKEYSNKLNRLILKDKRFNLDIKNKDKELGYINILFKEKPYWERLGYEDLEEYKKELQEIEGYDKKSKRNNHGFDEVLGDTRYTELMYNDEFWKTPELRNENRRTH